jgi:hypothetical protein
MDCPSGLDKTAGECVQAEVDHCYVFDDKDWTVTVGGITAVLDADEQQHPRPIYNRGLYFDGDDYIKFDQLLLNTHAAIAIWAFPDSYTNLFTI